MNDEHESEVSQLKEDIGELEEQLPEDHDQAIPAMEPFEATMEFGEDVEGREVQSKLIHSLGKEVDVADRHVAVDGNTVTTEVAEIYFDLYGDGAWTVKTTVQKDV